MREYREVRRELLGDEEAATHYIGVARTLLGQLKNRAAQGGLAQLARRVVLPDGVTIEVDTRFGRDTVRITAPPTTTTSPEEVILSSQRAALPTASLELPPITLPPGLVIAGDYQAPSAADRAVMWRDPDVPMYLTVSLPGRTVSASNRDVVQGVTADGSKVAGYGIGAYPGYDGSAGFIWSAAGAEDVGRIGTAATLINGLSADGATAGGNSAPNSGGWNSRPMIWTRGEGIRLLPMSGAAQGFVTAVSADGKTMVGRLVVTLSPRVEVAVVWTDEAAPVTIASGTSGRCAMGVSGNGRVVCGFHSQADGVGDVYKYPFRWTAEDGLMVLGSTTGMASAVSADGSTIVGSLNTFINETPPEIPRQTFGTPTAFYWTEATGLVTLGAGIAYCVSADGSTIGGVTLQGAVLWDRQGGVTSLGGGVNHIAKVVAKPLQVGVPGLSIDL